MGTPPDQTERLIPDVSPSIRYKDSKYIQPPKQLETLYA